jgi:hypothetical protein
MANRVKIKHNGVQCKLEKLYTFGYQDLIPSDIKCVQLQRTPSFVLPKNRPPYQLIFPVFIGADPWSTLQGFYSITLPQYTSLVFFRQKN